MPKLPDVPDQLWISDTLISRPAGPRKAKVAWTPQLLAPCFAMREAGATNGEIASMLLEQAGAKVSRSSVQDYLAKHE